ncbi:hypothetical protein FIU87_17145 [Bacillus sp. THAF10]|uniref:hypothetical protein n=1 Tax=Bacillus sp. THAF10 TaxID=2587848 RepID=UPI001268BA22|nr:hypothetical protein [Bacillus sp. THAF10]QFT90369.1 hypothetical protein FIU87_17145 [Bacillus sp. THAF10]
MNRAHLKISNVLLTVLGFVIRVFIFYQLDEVIMMTSFNETAIISYVESRIKEYYKEKEGLTPGESDYLVMEGKIEAYNEFLEQFGYSKLSSGK